MSDELTKRELCKVTMNAQNLDNYSNETLIAMRQSLDENDFFEQCTIEIIDATLKHRKNLAMKALYSTTPMGKDRED